jgi:type I restriction enzyme R subunit
MTPEQKARERIDAMLALCGWEVQDYKKFNASAGRGIALREVPVKTGPCDYLLLVDRKAVGVIEAKKEGTTLSTVADQSQRYGSSLPEFLANGVTGLLPFLYESTGIETFFRDSRDPDSRSRLVFAFHRPETLAEWSAEPDSLRRRLSIEPDDFDFSRFSQRGGLGNAHQVFGDNLNRILDELNLALVA